MSLPKIVSREDWLVARKKLLDKEKRLTRQRDRLNAERRRLPMVEIDKEYVFEGTDGKATLLDLFDGCAQLIVQHFMFDPEWDDGCPSCSAGADENSEGLRTHLHARNTNFVAIRERRSRRSRSTRPRRVGPSTGTRRSAPTSTTTSTSRSMSGSCRSSTTTRRRKSSLPTVTGKSRRSQWKLRA